MNNLFLFRRIDTMVRRLRRKIGAHFGIRSGSFNGAPAIAA